MTNFTTLVEYFVHGEQPLQEGFFSKYFTGTDDDSLDELKAQLKVGYPSERAKQKALDEVDELIDNSNRVFTPANIKAALVQMLPFAGTGSVIGRIVSACNGDSKRFREALHDIRPLIKAAKIKE